MADEALETRERWQGRRGERNELMCEGKTKEVDKPEQYNYIYLADTRSRIMQLLQIINFNVAICT